MENLDQNAAQLRPVDLSEQLASPRTRGKHRRRDRDAGGAREACEHVYSEAPREVADQDAGIRAEQRAAERGERRCPRQRRPPENARHARVARERDRTPDRERRQPPALRLLELGYTLLPGRRRLGVCLLCAARVAGMRYEIAALAPDPPQSPDRLDRKHQVRGQEGRARVQRRYAPAPRRLAASPAATPEPS
jgi:hypothetical protein